MYVFRRVSASESNVRRRSSICSAILAGDCSSASKLSRGDYLLSCDVDCDVTLKKAGDLPSFTGATVMGAGSLETS